MTLRVGPLTLRQANDGIELWHRHHKPVRGHRFSIGAYDGEALVGVCVIGRPVGRAVPQYTVCEVTRLATDGTANACSKLYGAAARAAKAMGFEWIQTYTLASEGGASLRASGWLCDGVVRRSGAGWNNRPGRRDDQPTCAKTRWRLVFVQDIADGRAR